MNEEQKAWIKAHAQSDDAKAKFNEALVWSKYP